MPEKQMLRKIPIFNLLHYEDRDLLMEVCCVLWIDQAIEFTDLDMISAIIVISRENRCSAS